MTQSRSTRSLRGEYLEWIDEQLEEFKDSIPRSDLLQIADEVVRELQVTRQGQYQLTEVLLSEAVDKRLIRMLKLPGYRSWRAARLRNAAQSNAQSPDVADRTVSDRHDKWPQTDTPNGAGDQE